MKQHTQVLYSNPGVKAGVTVFEIVTLGEIKMNDPHDEVLVQFLTFVQVGAVDPDWIE